MACPSSFLVFTKHSSEIAGNKQGEIVFRLDRGMCMEHPGKPAYLAALKAFAPFPALPAFPADTRGYSFFDRLVR
jgi:hypothetical protein